MDINAILVFFSAFFVSALSGVASLLRSNTELSFKKVITCVLNNGMLGLGISLIWFVQFKDNVYMLVGICLISGLGGTSIVDFFLAIIKNGGFKFQIGDKNLNMELNKNESDKKTE